MCGSKSVLRETPKQIVLAILVHHHYLQVYTQDKT